MYSNDEKLARILLICQKNGMQDDILTISPDTDSTGYNVRFDQKTIMNTTDTYMENKELAPYLYRFFRSIETDMVPYDCVQIDSPTFPTVVITSSNLLAYYPVLVDQIQSIQTNWPTETNGDSGAERNTLSQSFEGAARILLILQHSRTKDTILTIVPDEEHQGFYVRLDQKELRYITETYVGTADLVLYMERFFRAMMCDEEPCESVQFDCPLYPTTIIELGKLNTYFSLLVEQIYYLQFNWPMEKSGSRSKASKNSHQNVHDYYEASRDYDWDVLAY